MPKSKQNKNHKQNIYRMRGCSKNTKKSYFGGTKLAGDFNNLAYPYNGPITPNPFLAPTNIKGGYKCPEGTNQSTPFDLGIVTTSNVNGVNPLYPNTGPPFNGFNFLNPITNQRGGNCGCGISGPTMFGGARHKKMQNKHHSTSCNCKKCNHKHHSITCNCNMCKNKDHRIGCRCSLCKIKLGGGQMSGGGGCSTSNNGIPYPNGLVGKPYANPTNLPGANHIPGDANFYKLNTYKNDVSRQMVDVGANPPFLGFFGLGGGKGRKSHKKMTKTKKQRGGTLSNFLGQDLINLGRQVGFGIGSAYNALNGYSAPTNPLPWKGQLPNTPNLNTIKHL